MDEPILLRTCKDCKQEKPLEEFPRRSGGNGDLRRHKCRNCHNREYRERASARGYGHAFYFAHREDRNALARSWRKTENGRAAAKAFRPRANELARQAYAADLEAARATRRRKYETNPERAREYARKWYAENKQRAREQARIRADRRKALKYGATIGDVDHERIWRRDQGLCYLCGQAIERGRCHFDHVIPLSRGGAHSEDNIRSTHAACNQRKYNRLPEELR